MHLPRVPGALRPLTLLSARTRVQAHAQRTPQLTSHASIPQGLRSRMAGNSSAGTRGTAFLRMRPSIERSRSHPPTEIRRHERAFEPARDVQALPFAKNRPRERAREGAIVALEVDIQRAYDLGVSKCVVGNADEARHLLVDMADEIGRLRQVLVAAKDHKCDCGYAAPVGCRRRVCCELVRAIAACEAE